MRDGEKEKEGDREKRYCTLLFEGTIFTVCTSAWEIEDREEGREGGAGQ